MFLPFTFPLPRTYYSSSNDTYFIAVHRSHLKREFIQFAGFMASTTNSPSPETSVFISFVGFHSPFLFTCQSCLHYILFSLSLPSSFLFLRNFSFYLAHFILTQSQQVKKTKVNKGEVQYQRLVEFRKVLSSMTEARLFFQS